MRLGEENVVQVVMDNKASFKAASEMLMRKKHHLYWTPCVMHCIDFILEDIGKAKNVKETINKGRKITSLIYNK